MFVLLSKTLDWLLSPLSWVFILLAVAIYHAQGFHRVRRLLVLSFAVLWIFSAGVVATALGRWAERSASSSFNPKVTYDAVIVLGGGLDAVTSIETGQLQHNAAVERLLKGYELLRSGQARHVLLSGGAVFPRPGVPPEAQLHRQQLMLWGIDPSRIVIEDQSRNTHENAVLSGKLVASRQWSRLLLVTSAWHMPRAEGCFRAAGVKVDTLPVDHRAGTLSFWDVFPRATSLSTSSETLRELAGRVVYRLRGYTTSSSSP